MASSHRRFSTVSVMEVDSKSRKLVSTLVLVGTLSLATGTLIGKWQILQSVHKQVIDRYENNQPLFFQRPNFCRVLDLRSDFNIITFPAACLLIVIFIITTKRMSFHRDRGCRGFIGPPIPVDFFAHVRRTFSAVIFAIFADELLEIVNGIVRSNNSSKDEGMCLVLNRLDA